jgi:hypothetical protein
VREYRDEKMPAARRIYAQNRPQLTIKRSITVSGLSGKHFPNVIS